MYTFTTQAVDPLSHYFFWFYLFVWTVWTVKAIMARRYHPFSGEYSGTTCVLIPVVDETPERFHTVLRSIMYNEPTSVFVIINGPRNLALEEICHELGVEFKWTSRPGKRNAVAVGVERTSSDIVILGDSDTVWEENTLVELTRPFADTTVGGVTSRQAIYERNRNVLTRFADWMEGVRADLSMPAMSVTGAVGCLPGRAIAFRREIVQRNLDRFLHERFLGVFLEVSDDRTLTNFALQDGWRTVYQATARVTTDAPTSLQKYIRQQLRWARGSQYNTLRMLRFMVRRTPFLAFVYITDIIIPFFWVGTVINLAWKVILGAPNPDDLTPVYLQVILVSAGLLLSASIRTFSHLRRHPEDWPFVPLYVVFLSLLLTPIRIIGFFRMCHESGWGTRDGAYGRVRQASFTSVLPLALGFGLLLFFGLLGPLIGASGLGIS